MKTPTRKQTPKREMKGNDWIFADTCGTCSMPVFWRATKKLPEVLRYCSHGIQPSPIYGPHGSQVWTYPHVIYGNTATVSPDTQYTLTTGGSPPNGGN
jgi:hypothetical protein